MVCFKHTIRVIQLGIASLLLLVGIAQIATIATKTNQLKVIAAPISSQKKRPAMAAAKDNENHFSIPSRLVIAKIGIDTSIAQMGLTASGDMEAPKTNEATGWYKYGPHPGDTGSAVIAGHLGVGGESAVFRHLGQLIKGDNVSIIDDQGQTAYFVVTGTHSYNYDTAPADVFTSVSGAHLNLITCEGNWNASKKTYSQRLVIFTDKLI